VDLGPRRLRDLPTSVQVFQVQADGLRTDFPPLRALDASPGNLRAATTSFIGRESELDEVQAAIKAHRLVTLTGVGGVGKTRLAVEVASRLADEFPDGVWFFELAAVTDPAAVPDAVAAVLGITQQPGKSVAESVAAALEGRVRLLVFDNCEHVLDAAADLIEAILIHSATVRVVATSREGLGVAQEQVWPVPSLDIGAGIDSAAVSLFFERAQAIAPSFAIVHGDQADATAWPARAEHRPWQPFMVRAGRAPAACWHCSRSPKSFQMPGQTATSRRRYSGWHHEPHGGRPGLALVWITFEAALSALRCRTKRCPQVAFPAHAGSCSAPRSTLPRCRRLSKTSARSRHTSSQWSPRATNGGSLASR